MYGYVECPYCGYERKGNWDDHEGAPGENFEFQCSNCEKYFLADVEAEIEFSFISKRYEELEE